MSVFDIDFIDATSFPGVEPDGSGDCAPGINLALNSATPGQVVYLRSGTYSVSSPIIIPPYVTLQGCPGSARVSSTNIGTTIRPSSKWLANGASLSAVILLYGQTPGGYSTTSEEQKIISLCIDGVAGPASLHGIGWYGAANRVQLREVLVRRMTGDGIHQVVDGNGNQPDATTAFHVFSRFNGGYGFYLRSADSNWTKCLSTNSTSDGWYINTTANTQYVGCRSEHAGGIGYNFNCNNNAQSSGSVLFSGCSTDQSTTYGFQANGPDGVTLTLSGCSFRRDGANAGSGGGSYAAIQANSYPGQLIITGCQVFPGVNDDGSGTNSPQFALAMTGSTYVQVSGCSFQAATTAISDDGTNTAVVYDAATSLATGTTASPTIVNGVSTPSDGYRVPEDYGHIAWNMDMSICTNNSSLVNGTLYMNRIKLRRPRKITNILFGINAIAVTPTANENFVALVNSSGSIVGSSATGSLDSKLTSLGIVTQPLSTAYVAPAGDYYVVILTNCGTPPQLMRGSGQNFNSLNLGSSANKEWWATNGTTATALPGSFTLSSNSITGAIAMWVGVS